MSIYFVTTYNKIGDEGAKAIAEGLKTNKTLTEIDLSDKMMRKIVGTQV